MTSELILSLIGVLALATIHIFAGHLHRGVATQPTWLTAASGMSVAYVFVHLLPELAHSQQHWLEARPDRRMLWLDSQIYLAALLGVILALALDRVATGPKPHFWMHVTSFAIYNALIGGFGLVITGVAPMLLAVVALGAHFLINDHRLYRQHGEAYKRIGRWVLAGSVIFGWLVATVWDEPVIVVAIVLGLVSGGIILNVIKDELPEQLGGKFTSWVTGALGYAVLLLAMKYSQSP